MLDRIDFYEVRKGTEDDWDSVCLCKEESQAEDIVQLHEATHPGMEFFIVHVEIIARVDLEMGEY